MPREGHDNNTAPVLPGLYLISIHVPREGHDRGLCVSCIKIIGISIHVPREGHDLLVDIAAIVVGLFQSTCPARGTTLDNINLGIAQTQISIHVPREGHDAETDRTFFAKY